MKIFMSFKSFAFKHLESNKAFCFITTFILTARRSIIQETIHPEGLQQIKALEHVPKAPRKDWPDEGRSTQKPKFVTQLRDLPHAKEGQGVHFEARLEPHNDPNMRIEWYHNGRPLEHGTFFYLSY